MGEKAGEPTSLYRKLEKQGSRASETPKVQRFQSKPTFPRPAYRCASSEQLEDGGKTRSRDDQVELLPPTPISCTSKMAGLPDENLIELLLHLKVRTHSSYSAFLPEFAIENHSGAGEDDPELPTPSFVRAHGSNGQD